VAQQSARPAEQQQRAAVAARLWQHSQVQRFAITGCKSSMVTAKTAAVWERRPSMAGGNCVVQNRLSRSVLLIDRCQRAA